MKVNYIQAKDFLCGLGYDVKPSLERINWLLRELDVSLAAKVVHVAGTNGKGSVCSFIHAGLSKQKIKAGVYTSPPVLDYLERFKTGDKTITEGEFTKLFNEIRGCLDNLPAALGAPSCFEFETALALLWFMRQKVEVLVLEAGLGGRWDATNVFPKTISVITNVGVDHANYLGSTLEDIAREKAGIIKHEATCFTCAQDPGLAVIRQAASERNARLLEYGVDFESRLIDSDFTGSHIHLETVEGEHDGLYLRQLGLSQHLNACVAACVLEWMGVSCQAIWGGFSEVTLPCRFEVICEDPHLVLDGAHNLDAIQNLLSDVKHYFSGKPEVIYGCFNDKPYDKIVPLLEATSSKLTLTSVDHRRSVSAERLAEYARNPHVVPNLSDALESPPKKDTLITGSLYLTGQAHNLLRNKR
ncbi:MAG: hypothetical protein GF334_03600 [Candidatus Altiarchaeales archaeon]|nr:hypothetical protein [Candidatus Altiarchaeales archaeon]